MTKPGAKSEAGLDGLISQLVGEPNPRRRRQILTTAKTWWQPETVSRFYEEVVRLIHVDVAQAERMARAAGWLSERLGDEASRAASLRAMGHIFYRKRKYLPSLELYEAALSIVRCKA